MTSGTFRPTMLHRLWRLLPARQRRRLSGEAAALLAPRIDQPGPPAEGGLVVAGELSRLSGLGEGARLMLRGLEVLGVAAWPVDISSHLPAANPAPRGWASDSPPLAAPPPGAALVVHVNAPLLPFVLLRLPRAVVRGRRIIGYWNWELPDLPPDWRAGTRFVHEVWVPSAFTAAAIEPLLPGKVRVVPFPLAVAPPVPAALNRGAFGLPEDAVVVLVSANLASSFERKNPLGAIAAFRAAFGNRRDRILLLKIGNPDHFPADFAQITAAVADAVNIRIETKPYPTAAAHALTEMADVVLSLHRSEGFGLVLAEAMLLAKPVIATGWSGNMTFMNGQSAALVGYRLVAPRDPRRVYYDSIWAEPDQDEAVAHLRHLADDAAARMTLGARGRLYALDRLGAGPLATSVRNLGLDVPR
jgi:glycosyltransferase involved in cell wall biosynthesis